MRKGAPTVVPNQISQRGKVKIMSGMTADGNNGLGLEAHIGGGGIAASGGANASPHVAWLLIIGALLLLVFAGAALRKVRI